MIHKIIDARGVVRPTCIEKSYPNRRGGAFGLRFWRLGTPIGSSGNGWPTSLSLVVQVFHNHAYGTPTDFRGVGRDSSHAVAGANMLGLLSIPRNQRRDL